MSPDCFRPKNFSSLSAPWTSWPGPLVRLGPRWRGWCGWLQCRPPKPLRWPCRTRWRCPWDCWRWASSRWSSWWSLAIKNGKKKKKKKQIEKLWSANVEKIRTVIFWDLKKEGWLRKSWVLDHASVCLLNSWPKASLCNKNGKVLQLQSPVLYINAQGTCPKRDVMDTKVDMPWEADQIIIGVATLGGVGGENLLGRESILGRISVKLSSRWTWQLI